MLIKNSAFVLRLFKTRHEQFHPPPAHSCRGSTRRLRITTRRYSSASINISSRRVPLRLISMAGQMRLVDKFPVEHDFEITGSLELFEDHFVHLAARVDQAPWQESSTNRLPRLCAPSQRIAWDAALRWHRSPPESTLPDCGHSEFQARAQAG